MTYAAHTEWKDEKDVASFDRLLDSAVEPGKSHGTKELFAVLGGPRMPRPQGGNS